MGQKGVDMCRDGAHIECMETAQRQTGDRQMADQGKTHDLSNGWFANLYKNGTMTIRNPDLGVRTNFTKNQVDKLREIFAVKDAE